MCRLSVSRKRRPSGQVLKVSRLHPWQQSPGYGKDTDRPQRGVRLDEAMVFVYIGVKINTSGTTLRNSLVECIKKPSESTQPDCRHWRTAIGDWRLVTATRDWRPQRGAARAR